MFYKTCIEPSKPTIFLIFAHILLELDEIFHPDQRSSKTDKYGESNLGSKFLTLRQAIDCKMDTFPDKRL